MKFAICNETYQGWTLEKTCEHIAQCGYDGVEMAPFTMDNDPRQLTEQQATDAGKIIAAAGLEMVGLHWLLVKPEGLHLTTPDKAIREETVEFAKHLARLCAAMGGKVMVWGSPKQRDVSEGQDYEEAFANAAEGLQQVSEAAGALGVTLAMEPLSTAETNFLTSAEETVRLIEAVNHPACQLHLDVKAMSSEAKPIEQVIRENKKHAVHFHANDANLRGPGFGDIDFGPIAEALRAIDYEGYVSVEVFDYSPDPETIAVESLKYLRSKFAS